MRVLGDINSSSTAHFDSAARAEERQHPEEREQFHRGQRDIADIPLKITDERYRLECDRLREDEAWQEISGSRRRGSASARAIAVEEPGVREADGSDCDIDNSRLDLGSVSNELAQEERQRAAGEFFGSLGYAQPAPRQRNGAPWTAVVLLLMALAGIIGYGYLAMRENGVSPWRLPGVQTAIVLHHRLAAVQSRANADLEAARERSNQLIAAGRERWAHWRR